MYIYNTTEGVAVDKRNLLDILVEVGTRDTPFARTEPRCSADSCP